MVCFLGKSDPLRFVDLYETLEFSRRFLPSPQYRQGAFLLCPVWRGLRVLREGKWAASFSDIPESITVYPTGCSGWLYITNPATARKLAGKAKMSNYFWIDDVWVTGFLAREIGITHLDLAKHWTMHTSALLLAKSIQSPELYHSDYLAGPMSR
jgi:hypothetical protein